MKKFETNAIIFTIGGLSYGVLELLWRQRTHWTMIVTGGICFLLLYKLYTKFPNMNFLMRSVTGSLIITSIEFICGCIVNLGFHLNVWDYSAFKPNLLGQICLLYSVLWGLLCIPISLLCNKLHFPRFSEEKLGKRL